MIKFSTKAIATAVAGVVVAGAGLSTALAHADAPHSTAVTAAERTVHLTKQGADPAGIDGKTIKLQAKGTDKKTNLPSGVSTGTSFWDAETASGKSMSYHTLASPYWPLGTKVKIMYGDKSAVGVVEDFGPAEWAVAQHNPPAIIDLSEEMMQDFTGARENSVPIKFQVLEMGHGPVYRHSGTGYDTATGVSSK
jgi:hypothetical protein